MNPKKELKPVKEPKEPKSVRAEREILRLLAMKGPLNKYNIYDNLTHVASEPVIIYAVDNLEKCHQIKQDHVDPKARGKGGRSKYYDLDFDGLVSLLSSLDVDRQHGQLLWHVAEKYRSLLPDVFDLWQSATKAYTEDDCVRRLWWACRIYIRDAEYYRSERESDRQSRIRYDQMAITDRFLDPNENPYGTGRRQAVRSQPKLRKAIFNVVLDGAWIFTGRLISNLKDFGSEDPVENADEAKALRQQVESITTALRSTVDWLEKQLKDYS